MRVQITLVCMQQLGILARSYLVQGRSSSRSLLTGRDQRDSPSA